MNQTTYRKIARYRERLWQIHQNRKEYDFTIPLLDEPYRVALEIMQYDFELDPHEVGQLLNLNWQTIKQVRRALV